MRQQVIETDRVCIEPGCEKLGQHLGRYRLDGSVKRRARCQKHHHEHTAKTKGMNTNQWRNSYHKYKKHRLDYCVNKDGSGVLNEAGDPLGFKCTATIIDQYWQLDADHINGNPHDNRPENIQTLCKNCHALKTKLAGDAKTAGRKTRTKEESNFNNIFELCA